MKRRALDEVKYDPEFDYSFLSICKHGEYKSNSQNPKNIVLIPNSQAKSFVQIRAHALVRVL